MTSGTIRIDEVTRHNICIPNIRRWFDGSPNLLLLSQHSALGLQTLLQLVSLNDIKNDWRWGGYHTWSNTVSPPQIYVTHPLRWFTLAMTHHKLWHIWSHQHMVGHHQYPWHWQLDGCASGTPTQWSRPLAMFLMMFATPKIPLHSLTHYLLTSLVSVYEYPSNKQHVPLSTPQM